MINEFDKRIGGEENQKKEQAIIPIINRNYNNLNQKTKPEKEKNPNQNKEGKFVKDKLPRKTPEEILKEKEEKLLLRKKTFRKLNKKTPHGQPVMKYQMEHLFNKIKDKIQKGII